MCSRVGAEAAERGAPSCPAQQQHGPGPGSPRAAAGGGGCPAPGWSPPGAMVTGGCRGRERGLQPPPPRPAPVGPGRAAPPPPLLLLALPVGLGALCFGNSLRGEFVHDDVWAIVNNPDVRPAAPLPALFADDFWGKRMADNTSHKSYRPLCTLTFKLNILLAGMNPFYFHAVNVILHCLVTVVLMYTCDKAVFKDCRLAFVTALFFAVHPIHTEAVTGIVGRADVLACLLFLLAFLSYNRSVDQLYVGEHFPPTASPFFLLLSLFLGTCAVLVKETGITVFGVCLVYDFFSLSCSGLKLRNGRVHQRFAWQPAASSSASLQIPLSSRENGKHRFAQKGTWNSCHPTSPEEQRSSSLSVSNKAMRAILSYLTANHNQNFLYTARPFLKRAALVISYVLLVLYFRLWIMGGSMPMFSEQDNPASFSPYLLTSMGYCILFVHGFKKLCTWLNKCGVTAMTLSALLLLLLFSWKTVKQNEIWLSRESLFSSGVKTQPHNAKVHYNYANFLKDQGRHNEAIYHYKTAVKLYPRHASALNNLGTLTKDLVEAKEYYRRALQLNPQHNRALFNLGNLIKSQGKKEEAITLLRDSIKYGPEFADAYSSLASLLAEQERFKEAEEVYKAGIENCPESSDLRNNYGVFLVDTGAPEKAVSHYQQAIQLGPNHHVAMVNLGRLYRSLGQNKEAEAWYKRALKVSRKAEILSPLGALYYNTGRYEEALQVYREAAVLQPSNKEIRLALAQVLAMMGRTKEAEKMTNHIVTEDAECLECYRLLSAIYSKQENYAKALEAIDKALQLKPKDPKVISELFFTKGNQLREQNLLEKAFENYKLAVELNPDQAQAWMNMGGIEHIKGNYVTARGYYKKALELVPNSKLLKENLAKLDRLEKRLQEVRGKDHT
ncbi:protein O-mannosyl-transferase TMTC1 isoform X4 [Alligator mississippiensis]|uniref:protein O-mannosyl-transferase TMTC1 isoform X4 n=1 Tax=Alligator mississippiensis TaxID=8496 RepID=UPI0028778C75|nr:protein O-mannosyl-transferase TMTC1 isoform X4 [Alligator mississippiensis]